MKSLRNRLRVWNHSRKLTTRLTHVCHLSFYGKSADPAQTPQNATFDQDPHCFYGIFFIQNEIEMKKTTTKKHLTPLKLEMDYSIDTDGKFISAYMG